MRSQAVEIPNRIGSTPLRVPDVAWRIVRCIGAAMCGLALGIGAAGPSFAGADKPRVAWGFVEYGNQGCDASCFLNPKKNGAVYVAYLGTGSYQVELERLAPPGSDNFQVSSALSADTLTYCMTPGWNTKANAYYLSTVYLTVNCYDATGNPADMAFSFLYQSRVKPFGTANKGIAFLWADQPTEASYTPNLSYQYNSTGATNTMIRIGTGSYTATIPGLTKRGGNVQVTAYGNGPARCKVSSWSSDQSGTNVNVLCFDSTNAAADEMFTLAYTIGEPMGYWDYK